MLQPADQIGRGKPLTPAKVPRDESAARALFIRYRFAENGGEPFCPRCGCDVIYNIRSRGEFKCKSCQKRFSPTSGTAWAYRKLSYYNIMQMVAKYCHESVTLTASDVADDLEVQYKTAFTMLHKFRGAIKEQNDAAMLSGEIEIDGGEFGGHLRPKNTKKERTDHRKFPNRDKSRTMHVVIARERGGRGKAWVVKHEGHPKRQIMAAVTKGSVIYSDKAPHWGDLRSKHKLLQVNHKESYWTPEASTNFAESLIGRIRKAELIHGHITQNYLDLYANDSVWRAQYPAKRKAERVGILMGAMSMARRSEITGYFQKRKRDCQIISQDGKPALWRPATRAERDQARRRAGKPLREGPLRPRRTQDNWSQGFKYISAADFLDNPRAVPNAPAVYLLLVRDGDRLLERCAYEPENDGEPWSYDGHHHLYTGESYLVRDRLMEHLAGPSHVRETLLGLQYVHRALGDELELSGQRAKTERGLTEWMRRNVLIGFKQSPCIKDYESAVLGWTASPLNSIRRAPRTFTSVLNAAKAKLRQVTERWEPAPAVVARRPMRR